MTESFMTARLALLFTSVLLLAGCAAGPDYGYGYGSAYNSYDGCGWGGPCDGASGPYSYGPSLSLDFGVGGGDRDRGDRDRSRSSRGDNRDVARAGAGGAPHDREAGRSPQRPQAASGAHTHDGGDHDGGDHGHGHDR
jgi:hypothetical protein